MIIDGMEVKQDVLDKCVNFMKIRLFYLSHLAEFLVKNRIVPEIAIEIAKQCIGDQKAAGNIEIVGVRRQWQWVGKK